MAGDLTWASNGLIPYASYAGSYMQPTAPRLRVGDITEGNNILKKMKDMDPVILYKKPHFEITPTEVCPYSYAAFNLMSSKDHGQTCILLGLMLKTTRRENIFYFMDWISSKQWRVSHSAYRAKLIAC